MTSSPNPDALLTLWGRANSVNVQKPLWLLQELGLEFQRIDAGGPFGRLDSDEFKALSPHGEIPVLVDRRFGDPIVVWESAAVVRHLGEAASRAGDPVAGVLWPQDLAPRAAVDRWAEWAQSNWYAPIRDLFVHIARAPAADRNLDAIKAAAQEANRLALVADSALSTSGGYLAGPALTLADWPFAALLHRYMTLEIARPQTPALSRYYEALKTRPAYANVVAVEYDNMRVPGAERSASPLV